MPTPRRQELLPSSAVFGCDFAEDAPVQSFRPAVLLQGGAGLTDLYIEGSSEDFVSLYAREPTSRAWPAAWNDFLLTAEPLLRARPATEPLRENNTEATAAAAWRFRRVVFLFPEKLRLARHSRRNDQWALKETKPFLFPTRPLCDCATSLIAFYESRGCCCAAVELLKHATEWRFRRDTASFDAAREQLTSLDRVNILAQRSAPRLLQGAAPCSRVLTGLNLPTWVRHCSWSIPPKDD